MKATQAPDLSSKVEGMMVRVPASILALLCVGMIGTGCTAGSQAGGAMEPLTEAPAEGDDISTAGKVASALARGETAFAAGDLETLRSVIRELEALGAAPDDASSADLVTQWRQSVPDLHPPMRGRALGPAYRKGQLEGQSVERIDQLFLSGKKASVALEGPSGRRADLAIFDADNNAVCGPKDKDRRCQWIPVFTQRYRIEIANPGGSPISYFLVIE